MDRNEQRIFLEWINRNKIIPIIGDEAFYVVDGDRKISPIEHLYNKIKTEYPFLPKSEKYDYQLLEHTEQEIIKRKDDFKLKEYIYNYYIDNEDKIKLYLDIQTFLLLANFPVILTTSIFNTIEKELPGYNYLAFIKESILYKNQRTSEICEDINLKSDKYIIHLFGVADVYDPFVYSEIEFLHYLHAWHDCSMRPKIIDKELNNKILFFIGCSLPNWLFRFLFYSIRIGSTPVIPDNKKSVYWASNNAEVELMTFLNKVGSISSCNFRDWLKPYNDVLKQLNNSATLVKMVPHNKPYDLFLSYDSNDLAMAKEIYDQLTLKGVKVWFDKNEGVDKLGARYFDENIQKGLEESRYFMPLLSKHVISQLNNMSSNKRGLIEEWTRAEKNLKNHYDNECYTLPISIDTLIDAEFVNKNTGSYKLFPDIMFKEIMLYHYPSEAFNKINWNEYKNISRQRK